MSESGYQLRLTEEAAAERIAEETFRQLLAEHHDVIEPIARWGDGRCGYLCALVIAEFFGTDRPAGFRGDGKAKIGRVLAKQVFERDAYRCVTCGDHHDLTCDHIVPESLGGPTTLANLQTMCRPCNSRKGATMPESTL